MNEYTDPTPEVGEGIFSIIGDQVGLHILHPISGTDHLSIRNLWITKSTSFICSELLNTSRKLCTLCTNCIVGFMKPHARTNYVLIDQLIYSVNTTLHHHCSHHMHRCRHHHLHCRRHDVHFIFGLSRVG